MVEKSQKRLAFMIVKRFFGFWQTAIFRTASTLFHRFLQGVGRHDSKHPKFWLLLCEERLAVNRVYGI